MTYSGQVFFAKNSSDSPLKISMMKEIFSFLADVAANNNREWFAENRHRYADASGRFTAIAEDMISRIARFEPAVAGLPVKSTLYRFYRDTRFSPDKSPYKRHFGCYINPCGKKSAHGGYYLHLQPGRCMLCVGTYELPSPVLRAVRQSIVDNPQHFHAIMTAPALAALRPVLGEEHLKTLPKGFPRDFAYPQYLQPKQYDLSTLVSDDFFMKKDWAEEAAEIFRIMKPFLDFVNDTVDDYL